MIHEIVREITMRAKRVVIVGGHYCVSKEFSELSADSETEKNTFSVAVKMAKEIKNDGGDVKILLWVNDIGVESNERKELKDKYKVPESYRLILEYEDISYDMIEVYFESTIRNKASVKLRQLVKLNPSLFNKYNSQEEDLVRCIDLCSISENEKNVYAITGPEDIKLVVKEGPNPKCNLILATLFDTINVRMKPDTIVTIFNVIYENRIKLGLYVLFKLYGNNIPIYNILMDGDVLFDSEFYNYGGNVNADT